MALVFEARLGETEVSVDIYGDRNYLLHNTGGGCGGDSLLEARAFFEALELIPVSSNGGDRIDPMVLEFGGKGIVLLYKPDFYRMGVTLVGVDKSLSSRRVALEVKLSGSVLESLALPNEGRVPRLTDLDELVDFDVKVGPEMRDLVIRGGEIEQLLVAVTVEE